MLGQPQVRFVRMTSCSSSWKELWVKVTVAAEFAVVPG